MPDLSIQQAGYGLQTMFDIADSFSTNPLVREDLVFSLPSQRPGILNTKITLSAKKSGSAYGVTPFVYTRTRLELITNIEVVRGISNTLYDLLPVINERVLFQITKKVLGVITSVQGLLSVDDIQNATLPDFNGQSFVTVPLVAKPESFFVINSTTIRVYPG